MKNRSLLFLFFSFFVSGLVLAGNVSQIKGNKVLIEATEDVPPLVGSKVFLISTSGQKIGLVEVKQVKGNKAIAEILKGRAEVGASTQNIKSAPAVTSKTKSKAQEESGDETESQENKVTPRKKITAGFLFGYAMNSFAMDIGPITSTARESAKLTGTSFSLKTFGDYDFGKRVTFRGAVGIETLAAKASLTNNYCDDGTSNSCSVSFTYLGFEGSGHFNYLVGKTRAWVGLGAAFLLQASAQKNIPNLETAGGSNQMLLFSTGVDIGLSNGKFIPLVLETGIFPGTDVKANAIYLRGGYGFNY